MKHPIITLTLAAALASAGCAAREPSMASRLELAERRLETVEESRSIWRLTSAVLVVLAGVTLFAGAVLGSQARKEAEA